MSELTQKLMEGSVCIREIEAEAPRPPPSPSASWQRRQRRELTRLRRLHDTLAERTSGLIQDVTTLKDVTEAANALERLGRITDRVTELERQVLGVTNGADPLGDDFARLLKNAWERAYGPPPTESDQTQSQ